MALDISEIRLEGQSCPKDQHRRSRIADLPGFGTTWGSFSQLDMALYEESLENARAGFGFITNEQYTAQAYAQAAAQTAAGAAGNGSDAGTGGSGDGGWVDQSTGDVNLDTNTVTININGYFDFGDGRTQGFSSAPLQQTLLSPSQPTGQTRCPPYPDYPQNANLDANIRATRLSYMSANNNSPIETSSAFARNSAHVALFVAKVKPGGDWDYKLFSTSVINYERFGNFHYGAVGAAAGFTKDQLLRAAGFVQKWFSDTEGDGGSVNITNALTGTGGEAPFADQVRDQDAIKEGFSYYIQKFVLKVCK